MAVAVAATLCLVAGVLAVYRVVRPATCPTRPSPEVVGLQIDDATVSEPETAPESCELVIDVMSSTMRDDALSIAVLGGLEHTGWELRDDEGHRETTSGWYELQLEHPQADVITVRVRTAPSAALPTPLIGLQMPRTVGPDIVGITAASVVGFDPATARPVWSRSCASAAWLSPYASPEVDVAVVVCDGQYVGLDGRTGAWLWSHPVLAEVERSRLADMSVLLCAKSYFQVIDVHSGANRWRLRTGECAASATHGQVFVDDPQNGVYAYDERTGEPQYYGAGDPSYAVLGLDDGVVSRTKEHAVELLDKHDGTERWKSAEEPSRLASSGFRGATDHAIVLESRVVGTQYTAYDPHTGARLWTHDERGKDDSAAGADIFAISRDAYSPIAVGGPGAIVVLDDRSGAPRASFDDAVAPGVAALGSRVAYVGGTRHDPQLVVRVVT